MAGGGDTDDEYDDDDYDCLIFGCLLIITVVCNIPDSTAR